VNIGNDEETFQGFLAEAGEIIELLSKQLVDLEQRPNDKDLLNAIFRGFHTVKGGASFLQLNAMVDCCHITENIFDVLRKGKRTITSELMDVVLQALDTVTSQFSQVLNRQEPTPADSELITQLERFVSREDLSEAGGSPRADKKPDDSSISDELTEEEFDQLHGLAREQSASSEPGSLKAKRNIGNTRPPKANGDKRDLITDEEFENLLDQLHGGKRPVEKIAAMKNVPGDTRVEKSVLEVRSPPKVAALGRLKIHAPQSDTASMVQNNVSPTETTVRVDTQRLDDIVNMVGELVVVRNRLMRLGLDASDEAMQKAVANLDVVTGDLQSAVMQTRMQPIKTVFGRFPRVVRDLARNLKKEIKLELQGEQTDLDKNLVEALADPLVHLVRNSIDHGIELPDVRELEGKSREGTVLLAAEQEGDHILLSIIDDGAGMDPDMLRDKGVEMGIFDADAAARLTDIEAYNLIFAPGFSTKTEISDVSGRGVGMDVVKTKISQLNGSIEISSKIGEGTRFAIKVPLTLAIMPTLMIQLDNQIFAIPLMSVNEIFKMDLATSQVVDGQECIIVRDTAIPVFYLKEWLVDGHINWPREQTEGHVVVVSVGTQRVGFVVDQLIGQEEVVIKPLGRMLQGTPGMAGVTITGDGTIALILDVPGVLKKYVAGVNKVGIRAS